MYIFCSGVTPDLRSTDPYPGEVAERKMRNRTNRGICAALSRAVRQKENNFTRIPHMRSIPKPLTRGWKYKQIIPEPDLIPKPRKLISIFWFFKTVCNQGKALNKPQELNVPNSN